MYHPSSASRSAAFRTAATAVPTALLRLKLVCFTVVVAGVLGSTTTKLTAAEARERPGLLDRTSPFQGACISAQWPSNNVALKGLAIRLSPEANVLFDTDLLRMAAGWTGGFISTHGVALDGAHGAHPQIIGEQQFGAPQIPGWADDHGAFTDPRSEPFGPLPREWCRWDGLYVNGSNVVLSYTVHGTKVLEQPGFVSASGQPVFLRTFKTEKALRFTSSVMRARFHPKDGQLYVAGLSEWQSNAGKITGFDRVRYTGKPVYSVRGLKVVAGGVELTFTQPLDAASANDVQNFSGKRWNYERAEHYGSPELSVADPKKHGRDFLTISSTRLLSDGKTVFVGIDDLKPVMQQSLKFNLKAADGTAISQEVQHTIHEVSAR